MLNKLVETFLAALVLMPLLGILKKCRYYDKQTTILYFTFSVYLSAVYLFVGMPTLHFLRFSPTFTWIPLLPMLADVKNTVLNVILFLPLGVMLPVLWKQYRAVGRVLPVGFGLSVTIEFLQILTYRESDVNDVIANTLGAMLGYIMLKAAAKVVPAVTAVGKEKNEIATLICVVVAVMFFVQPYLANIYYRAL